MTGLALWRRRELRRRLSRGAPEVHAGMSGVGCSEGQLPPRRNAAALMGSCARGSLQRCSLFMLRRTASLRESLFASFSTRDLLDGWYGTSPSRSAARVIVRNAGRGAAATAARRSSSPISATSCGEAAMPHCALQVACPPPFLAAWSRVPETATAMSGIGARRLRASLPTIYHYWDNYYPSSWPDPCLTRRI